MNFQLQQSTIDLIGQFEGLILHPYRDSKGIPTIGYGTITYPNGVSVTIQDSPITKEQAQEYLLYHLNKIVLPCLNNNITVNLNQNQVDSVCSLVYNIGTNGFVHSHVLLGINNSTPIDVLKSYWMMWSKQKELIPRREKEFENYIS